MENKDDFETLEKEIEKELMNRNRDDNSGGDSNAISSANQARTGVLLRLLTAVKEEKEYRQAVLMADFMNVEEADRVSAALTEARRYGLSLDPIIDWIAARSAVIGSDGVNRARLVQQGLTHSTFTRFNIGGKNKREADKNVEREQ